MKESKLLISNIKKFRLSALNEAANPNLLIKAIQDMEVLYIYYAGDQTIHKGWRTIEPHVIGVSTAGNNVVRAWQQAGVSDTKEGLKGPPSEIPGWRLFRVDGITQMYGTAKQFKANHPAYNPNDSQMTAIAASVQPAGSPSTVDPGTDSIDEPDVTVQKVQPVKGRAKKGTVAQPAAAQPQQGAFANQTNKFKSFFNKDTGLNLKDYVNSRFNIMKHSHKKSPKNYFVGKRGNNFFVDDVANQGKYEKKDILGNLNDLFLKQNKAKLDTEKKSFFDKQRNKLNKKG